MLSPHFLFPHLRGRGVLLPNTQSLILSYVHLATSHHRILELEGILNII